MVNSRVIMPRSQEAQDLLGRFSTLDGAGQVCTLVNERKSVLGTVTEDTHPLVWKVTRDVFALFAYEFQRANSNLLLTPRLTLDLYSRTTGKPKISTPDGMDRGIEGVSIPDGIQLKIDDVREMRKIHRMHKYRAAPNMTTEQAGVMCALRDFRKVRRNLGIEQDNGREKTGRTLGGLLGNKDSRPVVLASSHGVHYTVPENSGLLQASLPVGVTVESLPIHLTVLRELTRAIIEEVIGRNLSIPPNPRILRHP